MEKKEVMGKVTKLDKAKQNRLKNLSQVLHILAKIGKVFVVIAAFCLLLAMVLTPVFVKNIKFTEEGIFVFENRLSYQEDDSKYYLSINEYKLVSLSNDEKVVFEKVLLDLQNTNMTNVFIYIELSLVFKLAILVVTYLIFNCLDRLFENFAKKETPFTNENLDYLKKIAKYSLITLLISFGYQLLAAMLKSISLIQFSDNGIFVVLILYVIVYVFEYAYILQQNSKKTIYTESK